ncbi:MAG: hypothetical protein U1C50_02875 [Patescibacteria group bacterium]|nr:hypothetical protein [Patescibacteria group bacterium]
MKSLLPLIFLLIATPVFGQEKLSTTVIPPRLELEALPGATLQEPLRIRNESATENVYQVIIRDFIVTNNQGTPLAVDETVSGRWSLASWMSVSPKQVVVPAGQTASLDLIITIPGDGLAGGHYAMVTYSPITEASLTDGTGAAINPQVGSLVYLKVIGDVTEAANLKEFKVANKFAYYGPIELSAEIENLGDIHLRPSGKLTVTNWLNDEVFLEDLEEKNIFPFASRTYDWTVPGKWRLGRYTARLTAEAGDAAIPISGLIYFWIVPVKEITMIAGALLLIIILIIVKRKKRQTPIEPVLPESAIIE